MLYINQSNHWAMAALFTLFVNTANAGVGNKVVANKLEDVRIGINWNGEATNIASALAAYVGIPYVDAGGSTEISVKQEKDATIADAINAINKQLHPNAFLRIADSPARMELAKLPIPASTDAPVVSTAVIAAVANPIVSVLAVAAPVVPETEAQLVTLSAPSPSPALPKWEVQLKDVTLSKTFTRWAAAAGYRMRWDAAKQVEIGGPNVFEMSFEEAVTAALSTPGIQQSEYPLEVCFYPNTPPLARVTRKGAQEKECK